MKWLRRLGLIIFFFPFFMMIMMIMMVGFGSASQKSNDRIDQAASLSLMVESYRPYVEERAAYYGMSEYVDLILAVMQVESGGNGSDPMQASESGWNERYPQMPNAILDPLYSIDVGIQALQENLNVAEVSSPGDIAHIKVALAGYNFGSDFIPWLKDHHDGIWSLDAAIAFSAMKASEQGWQKYGDPPYANKVMRYYTQYTFSAQEGEFIWPITDARMTQDFSANDGGHHFGIDISAWYGAPAYAPHDGKIVAVSNTCPVNGGYLGNLCPRNTFAMGGGNFAQMEVEYEGRTLYIIMMHMKDIYVYEGQKVEKGQVIGTQGNSGNSSGAHMHVEIHENTNRGIGSYEGIIDPKAVLGGL